MSQNKYLKYKKKYLKLSKQIQNGGMKTSNNMYLKNVDPFLKELADVYDNDAEPEEQALMKEFTQFLKEKPSMLVTITTKSKEVWNPANGKLLQLFDNEQHYCDLVVSNSFRVAELINDMTLLIDGRHIISLKELGYSKVHSFAFSPDSIMLAIGVDNSLILWDLEKKALITTLLTKTESVVEYSKSFGSWARGMIEGIASIVGITAQISSLAWSSDNKTLATGYNNKTVMLWDITSGTVIKSLEGSTDNVVCLAFSPDRLYLASGCNNGDVNVWDVASGKIKNSYKHSSSVVSIDWTRNSRQFASCCGSYSNPSISITDIVSGQIINVVGDMYTHEKNHSRNSKIYSIKFSPCGTMLASCDSMGKTIVWDTKTGKLKHLLWPFPLNDNHAIAVYWDSTIDPTLDFNADYNIRYWD